MSNGLVLFVGFLIAMVVSWFIGSSTFAIIGSVFLTGALVIGAVEYVAQQVLDILRKEIRK